MPTEPMPKVVSRESASSMEVQSYSLLRHRLVVRDRMNPVSQDSADQRALRILVVDDSQHANDGLFRLVRRWGHDIRIEHDGHAVLLTASGQRPDVIMLDIDMPHLNWQLVTGSLFPAKSASSSP